MSILNRRKLKFIGNVMRSESLEKNLLTGIVIGNRGRGRTEARLSYNIKDICRLMMVQVERKQIELSGGGRWRGARLLNHELSVIDDHIDRVSIKEPGDSKEWH